MKKFIIPIVLLTVLTGCGSASKVSELETQVEQLVELNKELAVELLKYDSSEALREIAAKGYVEDTDLKEAEQEEKGQKKNIIDVLDEAQAIEINKDEPILVEDFCEFTVTGVKIEKTINPPNPSGRYTYYEAKDGEKYLDVTLSVKNLSSSATKNEDFADVRITYDEKYEYRTSSIFEEKDGADLSGYTSLYSTDPLKTVNLHFLAAMPDEAVDSEGALSAKINVNGNDYILNIR